jgi:methyl-accepting chemotaxis protein
VNLSLRTRLTASILGITLFCLLLGFTVIALRQIDAIREQRLQAMSVIAEVVGDSATAALAFGDAADATDVLSPLSEFPDIEAAALYGEGGQLFATYRRAGLRAAPPWPAELPADAPTLREVRDTTTVVRIPVVYQGYAYGTIELVASNAALAAEIRAFVLTLAAIVLALVVLSVIAGWTLQRRITRPIFELAAVAGQVSSSQDASLRARTGYPGELGTLADGFNAMLGRLEARERELVSSRDTLRALIDASPVAIIGIDGAGTVTLWNARAAAILGAAEGDAIGRPVD